MGELEGLWKSTRLNQWYEPIAAIPRLGPPPDPREIMRHLLPRCVPVHTVPRANRIMKRWESLPELPRQLPDADLSTITHASSSHQWTSETAAQAAVRRGQERRREVSEVVQREIGANIKGINITWQEDKIPVFLEEPPIIRDKPHIPCTCCQKPWPKPWLKPRKSVGAAAMALIAEVAGDQPAAKTSPQPPLSGGNGSDDGRCGDCGGESLHPVDGRSAPAETLY